MVALSPIQATAQDERLIVFAAASLKNALDDINVAFTKATGVKVIANYDGSGELVRALEKSVPADVFISADLKWMNYAVQVIKPDTRVDLLGNRLVVIASKDSKLDKVDIGKGFDIAKLAGDGRIVIGHTTAVPAGIYAKAALESLGAWTAAKPKVVMVDNVRDALKFVARGDVPFGIVYETDAKIEPSVKIIGIFPDDTHEPIIYPMAVTARSQHPAVARYLDFLRSSSAKAIFEHYGFRVLLKPTS